MSLGPGRRGRNNNQSVSTYMPNFRDTSGRKSLSELKADIELG